MSDEEDDDELYYVDTLQIEINQVSNDLAGQRDAYQFAQGALEEAERWVALASKFLEDAKDDDGYALDLGSLLSSSEVGMNSAEYLRDKEGDVATHFQNTIHLEKRFSELCQSSFLAVGFGPLVLKNLEGSVARLFIRNTFPHFYLFVLASSFLAAATVFTTTPSAYVALLVVFFTTLPARQILMPAINVASDDGDLKKFKILHASACKPPRISLPATQVY